MPNEKLLPRNRTARLARGRAAGNPVVVEPEAGVGNCFPGLEVDLRNLERRFFPFLAVDFVRGAIVVVAVDRAAAQAAAAPAPLLAALDTIASSLGPSTWRVERIDGRFAGHGDRSFAVRDLGSTPDRPADAWTAVRLLVPGTEVVLGLTRDPMRPNAVNRLTLRGTRASYLADDGAFAAMFEPGELTQSLCSPWTHDFRDCGCFYWASNHPDIVQPALPAGVAPSDPRWSPRVGWLRADRDTSQPTDPAAWNAPELRHLEINRRWQELDVVLEGREVRGPYTPGGAQLAPLDPASLLATLRYAAGVELAVMVEYLSGVFSIDRRAGTPGSNLRDDARAARAELLRIAIGEMRHLREVNALLFDVSRARGIAFEPALGIATVIPGGNGVDPRAPTFRALDPRTLDDFVRVEAPSLTVDGLYGRILATFEAAGQTAQASVVRSIMADGADHFAGFRSIQEWLGRHGGPPFRYLRALTVPAANDPALATLSQRYAALLGELHRGYRLGIPAGASTIATARQAMLGAGGIEGACDDLAQQGLLPVFVTPADARFAPVAPPP